MNLIKLYARIIYILSVSFEPLDHVFDNVIVFFIKKDVRPHFWVEPQFFIFCLDFLVKSNGVDRLIQLIMLPVNNNYRNCRYIFPLAFIDVLKNVQQLF